MKRRAFWMATWALVLAVSGLVAADGLSETLKQKDLFDAEIVAGILGAGAAYLPFCCRGEPNLWRPSAPSGQAALKRSQLCACCT